MKILVTGANGQLGYDVIKELSKNAKQNCLRSVDLDDFDITNAQETDGTIYTTITSPDAVIHCSAYTAVEKAEDNLDRCAGQLILKGRGTLQKLACKNTWR